jgi:hypothetical protein
MVYLSDLALDPPIKVAVRSKATKLAKKGARRKKQLIACPLPGWDNDGEYYQPRIVLDTGWPPYFAPNQSRDTFNWDSWSKQEPRENDLPISPSVVPDIKLKSPSLTLRRKPTAKVNTELKFSTPNTRNKPSLFKTPTLEQMKFQFKQMMDNADNFILRLK